MLQLIYTLSQTVLLASSVHVVELRGVGHDKPNSLEL